jgi:predicted O-linked N-acetylglucosamine transferase (SPINDLY family)
VAPANFDAALESWRAGRPADAERLCQLVAETDPSHADALRLLTEIYIACGRRGDAISTSSRLADLAPKDASNLRRLSALLTDAGDAPAAIVLLKRSLTLDPENPRGLNNLGKLLIDQDQASEAVPLLERALSFEPDHPSALHNLGLAMARLGRQDEAQSYRGRADISRIRSLLTSREPAKAVRACEECLASSPRVGAVLGLKAQALFDLKRIPEALQAAKAAAAAAPEDPDALMAIGLCLLSENRPRASLAAFDRAAAQMPGSAKAHAGRGLALAADGRGDDALAAYRLATQLDPRDANVFIDVGFLMLRLNRFDKAHAAFAAALRLRPGDPLALEGSAVTLLVQNRCAEALPGLELLRSVNPDVNYLAGSIFHARRYCCDWTDFTAQSANIVERVRRGMPDDSPLSFMAHCDSAAGQLRCAETYARRQCAVGDEKLGPRSGPSQPGKRLRIGYLSADFREHAVAQQLIGVLEAHDRSKVETFAFSAGQGDGSALRRRLEIALEHWVDIGARSDIAIAEAMRELGLDIAVDLGGHTTGTRTRILAFRPAPVQVSLLGFPGTLGADFIDYIVADRRVVPDGEREHFAEQVIYLPDTYMPNDFKPPIGVPPTRQEAGLPQKGTIFCCFHAPYKLNPPVFDAWMRILDGVPDGILWLRDCQDAAKSNLAREAEARGVDPARLRYAPKAPALADYYARLSLADLFLDAHPYNAHTTACDALAAEVPVIAMEGRSFASRVSTSLLHAVGLPRLSVGGPEEYVQRAIDIAQDREELLRLKKHLRAVRTSAPLFDPKRYCRHLEAAYVEISHRSRRGEPPSMLEIDGLT